MEKKARRKGELTSIMLAGSCVPKLFLQRITKDYVVIPFCRGLHCDSLLHRITLRFPSTEEYIAIPFCRGLHCDSLLQRFTKDYIVFPFYIGLPQSFVDHHIRQNSSDLVERMTIAEHGGIVEHTSEERSIYRQAGNPLWKGITM